MTYTHEMLIARASLIFERMLESELLTEGTEDMTSHEKTVIHCQLAAMHANYASDEQSY